MPLCTRGSISSSKIAPNENRLFLSTVGLDALNNVDQLWEDLLVVLNTTDLLDNVLRSVLGHDLGELLGLLVIGDILEAEGHLDSVEEVLDGLIVLSELSSRADESLLARQLSERSTADT